MLKVNSTKMKQAMIVAALITGATWGLQMPSDAANLMVTIPSNYSKSIMGSITGSRVTTTVDGTPHSVRTENLNGDPGVFNFNLNGQSKIFLRQYTYSDTNLKPNEVLDVNGDWNTASASGKLTTTVNPHGVTAKGNTLYATGYDKGVVTVATISGNALTEDKTKAISLLQAAKDTGESSTSEYTSAASAHGEGIIVRGNDLYVQASVNKQGGYYNYDDGFLFHYTINSDGSLSHKANDFVRIGKNTDQSRINLYNDHIFVSAIGGDQKYGEGNTESSITAASLNNGALSKGNGRTISMPSSVKAKGQDFRDLKILPNGTAYVMCFNLGSAGGIDTTIYQTTVSNLYATNPKDWTIVHSGTYDGWFGKLNAEMYTHRLWVEAGQKLLVYTDGDTSPKYSWAAKDFGKSSMSQYNFMAMLQPDTVYGDKAALTAVKAEGLTTPSVSVTAAINSDAVMSGEPDYKYQITGTSTDEENYGFVTDDNSNYTFDTDTVILADKENYLTGDLTTNVLAAVDAHSGNDVTIDAGSNTLQLQSSHTIGSPSGIYAGNNKNVTVTAGKLNIITSGMTGGNSLTNGIWLDAPANGASSITIHAPTTNIAMTGGYGGNGIAVQKTDRWGEASDAAAGTNKITLDGNLNIKGADSAAAPQSAMTVSGDRAGLSDREAMETLAKKLTYTGYAEGERNLTGTVKVNEGLTTRSVARTGTISFDASTGAGSLGQGRALARAMARPRAMFAMPAMTVENQADGSTTYTSEDGTRTTVGSTETSMMKSVKSAMTTSMLAWRSGMTDMMQRMGDIRMGASDGIWARTYGGKAKYDKDHAYTSNSFWGAQVGADHALSSGWHIGAAFDYNDGDASYRYGGSGDPKQYLGSLYGTKTFEDGQYLDIVGKFGHTQNDYSVYNADGKKLDGKYSANGYGLSLEYGKRFGSSHGYVEPQIQLSYSKLGSDDYTGSSNFAGNEKMFIHQDGMDSFIGRLGIAAGKTTDRSSYYLKASVLHEFDGDTSATYTSESNGTPITIKQDFGDTWAELALGGTWKIGGSSLFYADITRSFGGDYEMQWKLNAGIRYAF